MKNIKSLFLLVYLFLRSICSFAQPSQAQKFLPVLAPASPEASAFTKYGNYDVNLFTGVPEISIPLYEITVGELKVPISISYHAAGIKVSDIPSRMGSGWDLQAGGSVSRKIMGRPDELFTNYLDATPTSIFRVRGSDINTNTSADLDYLDKVDKGMYDVEPDIFSYNFPGHGGKFLFNQKNSFTPIIIPYAPILVNYTKPNSNSLALSIKDEGGRSYKFRTAESANSGGGISVNASSAWMLDTMISSNSQDTINFNYVSGGGLTDNYFSDYVVINDNTFGFDYSSDFGTNYSDLGSVTSVWQQLTQINFRNGKVVFEEAPEARLDFSSVYHLQHRLNAIKIYSYDGLNKTYTLVKYYQFFHSYFISGTDASTKRLRLDSMQVVTPTGTVAQTYRFGYNTTIAMPVNTSRMKDYWGYFNNITNLRPDGFPTMVPRMQIPYNTSSTTFIGGDHTNARDPDPNYMQGCILQKITFPTGGSTQFEYETNQYLDASSVAHYAGGLRIKSIKSYTDAAATPVTKTYKYGTAESGYGRNNFLLETYFFANTQTDRMWGSTGLGCDATQSTKTTRTYFANPTNDLEGYDGAAVVYPVVTEYIGDGTTNAGKTIYTFTDHADSRTDIIGYGKPHFDSYHFMRGELSNKSEYRHNPDNSYSIVDETRNTYQYFPNQFSTGGIGLVVFKSVITQIGASDNVACGIATSDACHVWDDKSNYHYNNYDILTGDNKLVSNTTLTYDQNDITKYNSVTTNYTYDDVTHLGLTQTQTTNSKAETITSSFVYPYTLGGIFTSMTSLHIWDKTIQKTIKNNGNVLSFQNDVYSTFAGPNYLPAYIQLTTKTFAAENRYLFNQYDLRANILDMQKYFDVRKSYVWDYMNMYPTAEATNTSTGAPDIAYTSFEAEGKGNWTYTGIPFYDATAPTGKKCYQLLNSTSNITKPGLTGVSSYIVSYWAKGGAVSVNGIAGSSGKIINGWTYYEHKITSPVGQLITVSGTGASIDELRLYPTAAFMTTYTYNPLVGVTTQCDINNRITHYEYDGIGRLILVRDQDNNIIKKNCYNYTGQSGNCNIYYNVASANSFTAACSAGFVGNSVTYTVPANVYGASSQAEADLLAQNDVAANGQMYANTHGTCVPAITISGYNVKTAPYNIRFTNSSTGLIYNFWLNANQTATIILGQIPTGTYTVLFYPGGAPLNCTFGIAGLSFFGTGATFSSVVLNTNATASINN